MITSYRSHFGSSNWGFWLWVFSRNMANSTIFECHICRDCSYVIGTHRVEKECSICFETKDRHSVFSCEHSVCTDCIQGLVRTRLIHSRRTLIEDEINEIRPLNLPMQIETIIEGWRRSWTSTPEPSFVLSGHLVIWAFRAYSYNDWTLIDVVSGESWKGYDIPPPPLRRLNDDPIWLRGSLRWALGWKTTDLWLSAIQGWYSDCRFDDV